MIARSFSPDGRSTSSYLAMTVVGGLLLVVGALVAPLRVWSNLLLGFYYLVTLGLGAAVLIALTYVSGAGWSVAFRRVPEAVAGVLPLSSLGLLAVLGVRLSHYTWHPTGTAGVGTYWFKELWLQPAFFAARAVAFLLLWILVSRWMIRTSRRQDVHSGPALTSTNTRLSALLLVIFAPTFSLAGADWIMALEPMWFSTMWGVYQFAGMIVAALATVIILCILLRRAGPLHGTFTDEHLHDLGKLLFGFSSFWMYIWFSQYMLIWYTDIPEEAFWFAQRAHGAWGPIQVANLVLNWGVPFFVLLPRPCKRSESVMMRVAVLLLVGRWLDLYQMIFPATFGTTPVFGIWEVAAAACLFGLFVLLVRRSWSAADPIPRGDPYLAESLHYHV